MQEGHGIHYVYKLNEKPLNESKKRKKLKAMMDEYLPKSIRKNQSAFDVNATQRSQENPDPYLMKKQISKHKPRLT